MHIWHTGSAINVMTMISQGSHRLTIPRNPAFAKTLLLYRLSPDYTNPDDTYNRVIDKIYHVQIVVTLVSLTSPSIFSLVERIRKQSQAQVFSRTKHMKSVLPVSLTPFVLSQYGTHAPTYAIVAFKISNQSSL